MPAILHTIFFHRYFIPIVPVTRDLLDQTLPAIDDVDLETLIDQRATSLVRAIEPTTGGPAAGRASGGQSGRAQIAVSFYEKKRRKGYFFGKTDEEVCWEVWTLDVTCATPRTETGKLSPLADLLPLNTHISETRGFLFSFCRIGTDAVVIVIEAVKVRRAMEKSLQKTALKIINIVNRDKDHIPPITTTEMNPFPYQITVNPKSDTLGPRMGIF